MVVIDTTVWIDYLQGIRNPQTDWLDTELDRQRLGLTDVILCEVLQGVRDEAAAAAVERQLLKLEVFETGGVDLARATARNYRALRSRGHTVRKTIDCLIATFCLRENHSLLHRDRDFDAFERLLDLSVIHPQQGAS
jgi:predicted nucleic acid-binding protein